MKKIKILYIIDKLFLGGAQTHLLNLLKNLNRESFEPKVVCLLNGGELIEKIKGLGIEYKVLELPKLNSLKGLLGIFELYSFIKQEKFKIVHNYLFAANIFGTIAAKLANVPIIITSRRDTGMLREGKLRHILAYRITNKWVDKIICVSNAVKETVKKKEKVSNGKLEVIYNGVDLKKLKAQSSKLKVKKSLNIDKNDFVVGLIANFSWIKGHKDFLEAAKLVLKQMPNTKFLLIGNGPLLEEYRIQNTEYREIILFLGSRQDIPELLSIIDVSVNASYSEGMSNTILESMAAGVPVVATAADGNLETVKSLTNNYPDENEATGILVPPKDSKQMAEAIIEFLEDKELAKKTGENARRLAGEKFTFEIMLKNTERLYLDLRKEKQLI